MDYTDFEIVLKQSIGLDATTIGLSSIERAVRRRLQACSLSDWKEYLARVRASETELQALIETVVVPETWFFRDKAAFTALVALARQPSSVGHTGPLRLLSAPCASGEEPFSIVMALLDAGIALQQIQVDGWDISSQALAKARAASYGKNAFRGQDVAFRQRHFEVVEGAYRVKDRIRKVVAFHQGNLLSAELNPLLTASSYDAVFCRNLLIYLDRSAQERLLNLTRRLLRPNGVLFVAPAEGGLFPQPGFGPASLGKSFAFRRNDPTDRPTPRLDATNDAKPASVPLHAGPSPVPPGLLRAKQGAAPAPSLEARRSESPPTGFTSRLEIARHLADRGHLEEAARLCVDYLTTHGDSAEGYYLLGVVRDASGNEAAAGECYRKVLYLDPQHNEALWQLSLLAERQGDVEGATLLQERARRLQQGFQP
jgi:chemotaxis protein methyltransferase WspC